MRTPPHRVTCALAIAAALTLSAGCGQRDDHDDPQNTPHPTTTAPALARKGAVTRDEAKAILARYVSVNNWANAIQGRQRTSPSAQARRLLATVEGGQLLEQSVADYKTWRTKTATEQKDYARPFYYVDPVVYAPAGEKWFAIEAKADPSGWKGLLIFDQADDKGWRNVATVALGDNKSARLPAPIATDRAGLATAVNPTTRSGKLAPNQVADAFEDHFVTGGTGAGQALASSASTRAALKVYKERNQHKDARAATKSFKQADARHQQIYALKLRDGSTLAVVPSAHDQHYVLKKEFFLRAKITPNEEEAVFNPAKRIAVIDEFQGMLLAHLPTSGNPKILSHEFRMVDSQ
ncbi:hypothetical protein [Streptomyces tauricus]|uniref:hypothetical protein n=1 Tax=Streptomyces tauricus TaxID=68274 RepID=UPI002244DD77|nr:hypothetical protein [Streptomyces tauricus]MCW8101723.1 hypothetical protein [Streptomyces tauricus]